MKKLIISLALLVGCATAKPCLTTPPPKQRNYNSCMMLVLNGENGSTNHTMFVCEKSDMDNMFIDMGRAVNWTKQAWEKCGK